MGPRSGPTRFTFRVHPDLKNEGSEFFRKQCGNYNPQTNPDGFISGAQLRDNVRQHEGGTTGVSHYLNYKNAQDENENNVGVGIEAVLQPGGTDEMFQKAVESVFDARTALIDAANRGMEGEPCEGLAERDGSTAACVFNGHINFKIKDFGFAPCNGN